MKSYLETQIFFHPKDPIESYAQVAKYKANAPFENLTGFLLESWEQTDFSTAIIKVRKGVHFHDKPPANGRELDAHDFVAAWEGHTAFPKSTLNGKDKDFTWTAFDDWTVEIEFAKPDATGWIWLYIATMNIPPREFMEGEVDLDDWRNSDPIHELVILRQVIPWQSIIDELQQFYSSDQGRLGKSSRILVALVILGKFRLLSNRPVIAQTKENCYFQYFCNVPDGGLSCFPHHSILHAFRQRIDPQGVALLEETVFERLRLSGAINNDAALIDSSVLASNIVYPNDVQLIYFPWS